MVGLFNGNNIHIARCRRRTVNMADKKAEVVSVWQVLLTSRLCKTVIICFRGCGSLWNFISRWHRTEIHLGGHLPSTPNCNVRLKNTIATLGLKKRQITTDLRQHVFLQRIVNNYLECLGWWLRMFQFIECLQKWTSSTTEEWEIAIGLL